MRVRSCLLALAALTLATALGGRTRAMAQPIDLLRGARTELAVSSAYRDRLSQAAALVDGNLETAWNSRTGDLTGAWIEVRLPAQASVSSIVMTAGFTKRTAESDLFTGNHRVTRVRVLRDGQEVGVYDVDPASRELQTLPVTGPGGTYRIEIVALVPGTQPRWREVCVSELRIMGSAPGARAAQRFPRLGLRTLPPPRPEPRTGDRAAIGRTLREMTRRFGTEWRALNESQGSRRRACMLDEDDRREAVNLRARRNRFLTQLAELVELVDEVRGDQLRAASFARAEQSSWDAEFLDAGDHDAVSAAFVAILDWLGEDDARCRWATADSTLRLGRAVGEIRVMSHVCEHVDMDYPEGAPREVVRECALVDRTLPRMEEIETAAQRSLRSTAPRIRRFELPALSGPVSGEWTALQAELAVARQSCGWAE